MRRGWGPTTFRKRREKKGGVSTYFYVHTCYIRESTSQFENTKIRGTFRYHRALLPQHSAPRNRGSISGRPRGSSVSLCTRAATFVPLCTGAKPKPRRLCSREKPAGSLDATKRKGAQYHTQCRGSCCCCCCLQHGTFSGSYCFLAPPSAVSLGSTLRRKPPLFPHNRVERIAIRHGRTHILLCPKCHGHSGERVYVLRVSRYEPELVVL